MNIIIGNGQLKHHFWGEYSATIGIRFGTADYARRALEHFPGFELLEGHPEVISFHGTGDAVKDAEAVLSKHKADMDKVGSMRYSIDYGEPFTVEVDITPAPSEVQQSLFQEAS